MWTAQTSLSCLWSAGQLRPRSSWAITRRDTASSGSLKTTVASRLRCSRTAVTRSASHGLGPSTLRRVLRLMPRSSSGDARVVRRSSVPSGGACTSESRLAAIPVGALVARPKPSGWGRASPLTRPDGFPSKQALPAQKQVRHPRSAEPRWPRLAPLQPGRAARPLVPATALCRQQSFRSDGWGAQPEAALEPGMAQVISLQDLHSVSAG